MPRNVVILAAGSRGDVQPCVALGRELAAHGDNVRIIAISAYAPLAAGLDFAALSVDPARILESGPGREWLNSGRNPVRFVTGFKRLIGPMMERLLAEILAASKDADLILYPTLGFVGHHIAEHVGAAEALVHFQPSQPTSAFAHPLVPPALVPGGLGTNRLSFHAVDQLGWQLLRPFLNPWREEVLGLPRLPLRGPMHRVRGVPVLCCFSEAVVPRPADWPPYVHLTGYWFLDEPAYAPDPALADFLAAGPPPVYVGFGSMVPDRRARTFEIVRAALRAVGARGIVAFGGTPGERPDPAGGPDDGARGGGREDGLPGADDDVLTVGDVPHSWLFPLTSAVVHHGGAGTTAAALRAGVPAVVCPFFGDQHFWGERVAALGAGPSPLPIKKLDTGALAARVSAAVGDAGMRARATGVARRLAAEDGPGRARAALAGARSRLVKGRP